MFLYSLSHSYMYIIVIFCLNTRQNQHKFNFSSFFILRSLRNFDMGITQYQYWPLQVSTFSKFSKMPYKMLKYWQILWPLLKFHLFPSLGTATHIIWLHFGKFPLFPLYVWLISSKSSGIFRNFIIFIIKTILHT